ncbi:predicted protein [Enterococcus faecium Com12]|nr:predicted protein [Enterococcus faecium Com12]
MLVETKTKKSLNQKQWFSLKIEILVIRGCDRSGQLQEIRRNLRKLLLKFL